MTQHVLCNVLTRVSLKSSSIQSIAENVLRRPSMASGPAVYVASLSVDQFSMKYPEFSSLSRLCFRSTHCQYADWINTSSYNIIITHCRVEIMLNRCVGYLICYIHVQSKRSIKTYCIQFCSQFCSFRRYRPSHDNAKVIPLWQRHIVEVGIASSPQPSVARALCLRFGHTGCGETRRQAALRRFRRMQHDNMTHEMPQDAAHRPICDIANRARGQICINHVCVKVN